MKIVFREGRDSDASAADRLVHQVRLGGDHGGADGGAMSEHGEVGKTDLADLGRSIVGGKELSVAPHFRRPRGHSHIVKRSGNWAAPD
ncbi:MAG: hypothetical protein ACLQPN_01930 [Bryobacteraceae bacterium]